MANTLDTGDITHWRSIVVLIVFVITNVVVLFPFHIPVYIPRVTVDGLRSMLCALRVTSPSHVSRHASSGALVRFRFPMNIVTAPLTAVLFLLAILAIGREEVYDGTVGTDHIFPIEIMAFFITLAYIAISIDSSGLIRWLAFKVLQKGGKSGRRLFLYLFLFFFGLATLIGNDPIVLSGTPFLAYMTRASSNIDDPRAWIFSQFAVSNVASAILVSSNPTNLVLAGAFNIKFIVYTANIIVPVLATAVILCPFLILVSFRSRSLIPPSIKQHELPDEMKSRPPVNPNVPFAKGIASDDATDERTRLLLLEEIMNPYLDRVSATVGACVMTVTLVTILALNASASNSTTYPAYYITCPGAFIMLCWDLCWGWLHRHQTREIARKGREGGALAQTDQSNHIDAARVPETAPTVELKTAVKDPDTPGSSPDGSSCARDQTDGADLDESKEYASFGVRTAGITPGSRETTEPDGWPDAEAPHHQQGTSFVNAIDKSPPAIEPEPTTLVSLSKHSWAWSRETFPTATTVLSLLPYALVPFGLSMFVLVQALVAKGWVAVFAYGWQHWVSATSTVGAVGGMAFLSVVLCNFAGTNIGTTILLCRVVQAWETIHERSGAPIAQRTFWAAVYAMALGLNYGAFSTAFSASLAGLLWRDILGRKHIHVRARDFVKVNAPIIAVAMVVGCAVLIGEVYIVRNDSPYDLS